MKKIPLDGDSHLLVSDGVFESIQAAKRRGKRVRLCTADVDDVGMMCSNCKRVRGAGL